MDLMTIQTGDAKLDKAYINMKAHVMSFDDFESFYNYFLKIVKTDNKEYLNKWLCKVLFAEMKYKKHPFDELLELIDSDEKATLETWLSSNLHKVKEKTGA